MSLFDTTTHYGVISRINHWLSALLIITLLGIGLYFHEMPKGDERTYWLQLHIALGALFFIILAFRIVWRLIVTSPEPLPQPQIVYWISKGVQFILLLALVLLIVSGPLIVWTADRPINVFTWFSIPSPLGRMETLHEILEVVHKVCSRVMLFGIIIHVLGVVKHAVIDRAPIMQRMIGR